MARQIVIPADQRKREGLALKLEFSRFEARTGIKQNKVLEDLGINPGQPSMWFRGLRQIPANTLLALADYMGFSATDFRPQIEEELDVWLTARKQIAANHLERRILALEDEDRDILLRQVEAFEALRNSKK